MANETSKRLNPIIITDPESGHEYTLEFSRKSVKRCEAAGLDISTAQSKSMTMLPIMFWGAFLMHHPYMTQEQTDKILFDGLHGLTSDEFERLGTLYAEPYKTLIADEENGEEANPRKMTVKF